MKLNYLFLSLLLVLIPISCNRHSNHNDHDDEHHHHHDHVDNLQLVAYGNGLELYVQAKPFAVDHESEVIAHITRLDDFKPLDKGTVTARLITGSDTVMQTLNFPVEPGIFRFSLQPRQKGEARLLFQVTETGQDSEVVVDGLTVFEDFHDAIHAAEDALIRGSNAIQFTKEQSWKVDFATEEVRKMPFGQLIRTVGQLKPTPADEQVVAARTGGIVLFPGSDLVEGKTVAAGQTLFSIDGSGLADNNLSVRFDEARNEYERARAEYERKQDLAKDQIISQRELLNAKTEMENARSAFENLQRNFSAGKQVVSSPIGGFIAAVLVRNGQYVDAGQPVLRVTRNGRLFVKAELRPKYAEELNRIAAVTFRQLGRDLAYTLEELNGRVVSVGKVTSEENPLLPVMFEIDNRPGLIPGSLVELHILTATVDEVVTVADDAIVEEMGSHFVYVQLTPELFEKRPVRLGRTDRLRTEIIAGVSPGERVVSKGAMLVKLSQVAGAIDAHSGHAH